MGEAVFRGSLRHVGVLHRAYAEAIVAHRRGYRPPEQKPREVRELVSKPLLVLRVRTPVELRTSELEHHELVSRRHVEVGENRERLRVLVGEDDDAPGPRHGFHRGTELCLVAEDGVGDDDLQRLRELEADLLRT